MKELVKQEIIDLEALKSDCSDRSVIAEYEFAINVLKRLLNISDKTSGQAFNFDNDPPVI